MKKPSEISTAILVATCLMMTNTSPISLSVCILIISIMATVNIWKTMSSSWMAYLLILTFSSGMMTLFLYTASLVANEINKTKTWKWMLMAPVISSATIHSTQKIQESMKFFTKSSLITTATLILIFTLLCLSTHGHNPYQTLNSSF